VGYIKQKGLKMNQAMNIIYSLVAGFSVGVSIFFGVFLTFGVGIGPFMIAAMGGAIGMILTTAYVCDKLHNLQWNKERKEKDLALTYQEFNGLEGLSGVDVEAFRNTILEARKKQSKIQSMYVHLHLQKDAKIILAASAIAIFMGEILAYVKKEPQNYRAVHKWLDVYADQTINILEQYADIHVDARDKVRDKFTDTIVLVKDNLQSTMESLTDNTIDNLQIDLELLQDQMKQYTR